MLAYVNLVQRREKELNVDVLTHQKWSGAAYVDGILGAIQSGSSSNKSMGEGNTEAGLSQHPYDLDRFGGRYSPFFIKKKKLTGIFGRILKLENQDLPANLSACLPACLPDETL